MMKDDSFFKKMSDVLGQEVKIEKQEKKSKSRAEKRLQRKRKAIYRTEKKRRINEKKYGNFMFRGVVVESEESEEEFDFFKP
jgi:hypothetical protein